MSRLTGFIPVLAMSATLAGCVSVQVQTDQDTQLLSGVHCQSVSFAGGFKGASPLRNTIANPLNEQRLRDAITANLQKIGLTVLDAPNSSPGQCLVGYGIGMSRQVDAVYPDGFGYGFGYGAGFWGARGWGPGWGLGWGAPYVYRQSFITLDLYEAASKKPMWHASAEQDLSGLTGDAATKRIRAAVDAIFLKFPR